jgi:hypothetical protein
VGGGGAETDPERAAPQVESREPGPPAPTETKVSWQGADASAEARRVAPSPGPDPGPVVLDVAVAPPELSSAAPLLRWAGAHGDAEAGVIAGVVAHLRAALAEVRRTFRRTDDDPWRARTLWEAMQPCREHFAALLGAPTPQVMIDCADCGGGGSRSEHRPCPGCGGTGVQVFDER